MMRVTDLFEAHRADLYHFTNQHALGLILASDELRKGRDRGPFISMTRNAHWWGWNPDFTVRMTFDGDRFYALVAQQGLRIGPVEEPRRGNVSNRVTGHRANIGEREERIYGDRLTRIRSALRVIDVKRHRTDHAWMEEQHDLTIVALLAPLQRTYQIPINYEGLPLATFANQNCRWATEPEAEKYQFLGGEFADRGSDRGLSCAEVARRMFATLRV